MVRNVKDVQRVLDRLGGAGRGPWSLLRIVAWAAVGLVLVGVLHPLQQPKYSANIYNRVIKDPLARVVTMDKNDPRGFHHPARPGNTFTIAWVGPSTLQSISSRRNAFIPADVRARIPELDGRKVVVNIYFMSGGRDMDIYAGTLAALRSNPDMIVVDLNPVWVFDDKAVQDWDNLNGVTAVSMLHYPSDWGLAAQLFSPSDVVLGLAGTHVAAIRDRWSYAAVLRQRVDVFNRLDVSHPPPANPHPSPLDQVAAMQSPLEFWTKYDSGLASLGNRDRQLAFMTESDVSGGTVSDDIIDHLLASLAGSHRPAYVYVPPMAPDAMAEPAVSAKLAGIERRLGELAARHRSPLLRVNNESLGRVLPQMPFKDLVHVQNDGPEVTFLAQAICNQLLATSTVSRCTPLPPEAAR